MYILEDKSSPKSTIAKVNEVKLVLKKLGEKKEVIYKAEAKEEAIEEDLSPIKSQVLKAVRFDSLVEERRKFSLKLNAL